MTVFYRRNFIIPDYDIMQKLDNEIFGDMVYLIFLKIVLVTICNQDVTDSMSNSPERKNILQPSPKVSSFNNDITSLTLDINGNKQVEPLLRKTDRRALTSKRSMVQAVAWKFLSSVNKN